MTGMLKLCLGNETREENERCCLPMDLLPMMIYSPYNVLLYNSFTVCKCYYSILILTVVQWQYFYLLDVLDD